MRARDERQQGAIIKALRCGCLLPGGGSRRLG